MRITWLLASVPLAGVVLLIAAVAAESLRIASVVCSLFEMGLGILIWRKHVRWTTLLYVSTGGIVALVVAQALVWRPLWSISGWFLDEWLCAAQSLTLLGAGMAAGALLWWGGLLRAAPQVTTADHGRKPMTPNAVRLTLAVAMLPLMTGISHVTYLAMEDVGGGAWPNTLSFFVACEICLAAGGAVWLTLWRTAVTWNRRRRVITILLAGILLVSPVGILVLEWLDLAVVFCLPLFAFALWLAGTAYAWCTPGTVAASYTAVEVTEEAARCPKCGYSLRGLREVRCPECGWSGTVDEVLANALSTLATVP